MQNPVSKFLIITVALLYSFQLHAQLPNDCVNAVTVCGDSDVVLDVSGSGTNEFPRLLSK
ncbi:hypothetical protein N7U66_18645 [Lacinutrix neustonica]|uniref:Uncharacterized protein n=1 Tax=Lacinutrix neustonica TaxID=2980107 RepID=A0A9E8MX25_9FLAO|nr:hypothetical protein [Lacinutrix neustonica]WAC01860.1 hypothetical protein N7U66_18645 [Lacinutrix neustonica]